ncbi:ArsR/SmtB family transcription factor [Halobacteriales archaeon Cl-PHB]
MQPSVSEECDLEAIAGVLEDESMRTILAATSTEPMSASELADRVEASKPTVYRRIERLETCNLIESRTRPDEDGHHHQVYAATFDHLTVDLVDGDYEYEIERTEPMADTFTRLIEQM